MRRPLVLLLTLSVTACAGSQKPSEAPPQAEVRPLVIPGFEKQPDEILTEHDLTHDGKADLWKYVAKDKAGKDVLLRKEKDLNGDGKVDAWEKYAPDGALLRVVYDLDFDAKPDVTLFYEKEQLVKKELAFGFDGVPRSWNFYEKGKLVRKERDTNGDTNVDYWEYWENGEVDRIGVDDDGDGQVDRWEAKKSAQPEQGEGAEGAAAPASAPPPAPAPPQK